MQTTKQYLQQLQSLAAAEIQLEQKVIGQVLIIALGAVSIAEHQGMTAKRALELMIDNIKQNRPVTEGISE